jgi:hypothetical protein
MVIKTADNSWAWWLTTVIPATWEAEIWRIEFLGSPGGKVYEAPFEPVAGYGGVLLSSSLHRKRKQEDCGPVGTRHKHEALFKK